MSVRGVADAVLKADGHPNNSLRMNRMANNRGNALVSSLMPRKLAASFGFYAICGFAFALAYGIGGQALAQPGKPAPGTPVDIKSTSESALKKKQPAHQVPAATIQKLLEEELLREKQESEQESGDSEPSTEPAPADMKGGADEQVKTETSKEAGSSSKEPEKSDAESAEKAGKTDDAPDEKPTADAAAPKAAPTDNDKSDAPESPDAGKTAGEQTAAPGLPRRKPRKPAVQPQERKKADGKKKLIRGSDRQKYLCKALQSCRNDFVKCKSKIKHPDQSPQWSIAKEECGAVYKACVEEDFQSGEWFFTRWFYFQELNCK